MRETVFLIKTKREPSVKDIERAVSKLLDMMEETRKGLFDRGTTILIKPNVTMGSPWTTGTTTCPYVVSSVAKWCLKRGAGDVIVGEGSMIGVDTMEAFKACGFDTLAEEVGFGLIDLNKEPTVRVGVPDGLVTKELYINKKVLDVDFVVDIAKLKTHILTLVTLGMKNMKGVLPHKEKRRLHFIGLERGIVDLISVVRPNLTIIEGIIGQEGLGPLSGDPVEMDLLIGGFNVVETDAIGSYVMGIDPKEVLHLKLANERGLGEINIEYVKVYGERIEDVKRRFKRPPTSVEEEYPGVRIINGDACSGCIGAIMVALKRMKDSHELDKLIETYNELTILVGPRASLPRNVKGIVVLCGKCLLRLQKRGIFIPGCPPQGLLIRDVLRMKIGLKPLYIDKTILEEAREVYGS